MSVLNMCRTILSPGEYSLLWGWECRFSYVLYCEYGSCELFWNTNIRNWENWWTNENWNSRFTWKTSDWIRRSFHSHRCTTIWKPSDSDCKRLQVELYEDEEVLIEYTLANPMQFKDVVDCLVNDEKVHLTKEDLALSNTKLKIGLHKRTSSYL